jgi:membrane-bound lytic murein transglycosylase D
MHLLELGLRLRTADAVHRQALIALKLFHSRLERCLVHLVHIPDKVSQVNQPPLLAGHLIDGVQVADLDGHFIVLDRCLRIPNHERHATGSGRDGLLDSASPIGRHSTKIAVYREQTLRMGNRFFVLVFQHDAKFKRSALLLKQMLLVRGAGFLAQLAVGNEKMIAGVQNVGVLTLLFQRGIVGMIPDGEVSGETIFLGDARKMLSLHHGVIGGHPALQISIYRWPTESRLGERGEGEAGGNGPIVAILFHGIAGVPMSAQSEQSTSPGTPRLRVTIAATPGEQRELHFRKTFRIGRSEDCDVCIKDEYVSRNHAEVSFESGQWSVRDLQSGNGIFIDRQRVEAARITQQVTIRLGIYGPMVTLEVEQPPVEKAALTGNETLLGQYIEHYFGASAAGEAGEHTLILRQAFAQVQAKQKWTYRAIMAVLFLAILAVGAYAMYERQAAHKQRALAQDLFYGMKSLDLDIASVETMLLNTQQGADQIRNYQNSRGKMEHDYDRLLTTLHVYDPKITEKERLVLRVTRIFGECELDMPHDFTAEVAKYIAIWQSSDRLPRAVRAAKDNGYTAKIAEELLAQDLPPQFFYLALQESNFDPYVSGPNTRKGIAKGMWQFIPETAVKYGLRIGPLVDLRRPDPGDDRDHWDRETSAAVRYLKDLYRTDAQASGFLVMASYNWGEDQVLPLIRSMPANPKERNFWRLLSAYREKIPRETFDYVFYIASAAVIGENPRLFGFDFDNPLAYLEAK